MYDMKALYQARSVEDAVALRLAHPEAQIIAGGSDVLVQMREGRRAGAELISIQGLDEIRGVSMDADGTDERFLEEICSWFRVVPCGAMTGLASGKKAVSGLEE